MKFLLSRVPPHVTVTPFLGKTREGSSDPIGENYSAESTQVRLFLSSKMGGILRTAFVEDGELAAAAPDENSVTTRQTRGKVNGKKLGSNGAIAGGGRCRSKGKNLA